MAYTQAGQPSQTYQWTYDQTGGGFSYGIGRLTTAAYAEGATSYAYDPQGRLVRTTETLNATAIAGGNTSPIVRSTSYGYDAAGHLTSLIYPSGREVRIGYTGGLPTSVSLAASSSAPATALLTDIQFTPFGPAQSWNWNTTSGVLSHSRVFDASGRLVRYPLGHYLRDVTYDAAGRITSYAHYQTGGAGPLSTTLDQTFGYDALGRLTQATAASSTVAYSYDANGNRTSSTTNGSMRSYTIDAASNRLLALTNPTASFGYDAAGNTVSDSTFTLRYDLRGRLASVTSPASTTSYSYDHLGQRVRKIDAAGTGTTLFAYDPQGHLLGEYDRYGNALREYVWLGDLPVAVFLPDAANPAASPPLVYFIHADHLDTPRAVLDRAGVPRWTWYADAFGTTAPNASPAGQPGFAFHLRFPGQYYDAESGMHYNLMRDYIPSVGRYAQSDPIGLAGGINTFGYVGGNPILFVDPMGLAIGDFPPAPPGYNSSTWTNGTWPNGKPYLRDPSSTTWTTHPEDRGHWRHWDKQDSDGNDDGTWPPNSKKPWPGQKKPKADQCLTDPSEDAPPWDPMKFDPNPDYPQLWMPSWLKPGTNMPKLPRILPRFVFP